MTIHNNKIMLECSTFSLEVSAKNVSLFLSNHIAKICIKTLLAWNENLREINKHIKAYNIQISEEETTKKHQLLNNYFEQAMLINFLAYSHFARANIQF